MDVGDGDRLELVDKFCCLSDMLNRLCNYSDRATLVKMCEHVLSKDMND